eukprot:2052428-Rhodomonas_salina.1
MDGAALTRSRVGNKGGVRHEQRAPPLVDGPSSVRRRAAPAAAATCCSAPPASDEQFTKAEASTSTTPPDALTAPPAIAARAEWNVVDRMETNAGRATSMHPPEVPAAHSRNTESLTSSCTALKLAIAPPPPVVDQNANEQLLIVWCERSLESSFVASKLSK